MINYQKSRKGGVFAVYQVEGGTNGMYNMTDNGEDQEDDVSYLHVHQQGNFNHVDHKFQTNSHSFVSMHKVGEIEMGNIPRQMSACDSILSPDIFQIESDTKSNLQIVN